MGISKFGNSFHSFMYSPYTISGCITERLIHATFSYAQAINENKIANSFIHVNDIHPRTLNESFSTFASSRRENFTRQ